MARGEGRPAANVAVMAEVRCPRAKVQIVFPGKDTLPEASRRALPADEDDDKA